MLWRRRFNTAFCGLPLRKRLPLSFWSFNLAVLASDYRRCMLLDSNILYVLQTCGSHRVAVSVRRTDFNRGETKCQNKLQNITARLPSITNTLPGTIAKRPSTTSQVTTKQQLIMRILRRGIFITPHTMPLKQPNLTSNITDRSLKPPVTRPPSWAGDRRNGQPEQDAQPAVCPLTPIFTASQEDADNRSSSSRSDRAATRHGRTFICILVAIPSPVRGITSSSGAITRCSTPRTKVTATSSPRAGHADVSPAPSSRA